MRVTMQDNELLQNCELTYWFPRVRVGFRVYVVHGLRDGFRDAKSSNSLQFHIVCPFFPNFRLRGPGGQTLAGRHPLQFGQTLVLY